MFRVIAARSLKFSEHRDNRNVKMADSEVVVKKRSDIYKSKTKDRGSSTVANQYTAADKLRTPSVVAEIIQREGKKKKKERRGVWSAMGQVYNTHGLPDLELGEGKNVTELKRKVKNRKLHRNLEAKGDIMASRQQLENLVSLFMDTKHRLMNVNLFDRDSSGQPVSRKTASHGNNNSLSASEQANGNNHNNATTLSRSQALLADAEKGPEEYTVLQRLAQLGPNWKKTVKPDRKVHVTQNTGKLPRHLTESRLHHIQRWKKKFGATKVDKEKEFVRALVKRGQQRDAVYASQELYNKAVKAVTLRQELIHSLSASKRTTKAWRTALSNNETLWAKAKTLSSEDLRLMTHAEIETVKRLELQERLQVKDLSATMQGAFSRVGSRGSMPSSLQGSRRTSLLLDRTKSHQNLLLRSGSPKAQKRSIARQLEKRRMFPRSKSQASTLTV